MKLERNKIISKLIWKEKTCPSLIIIKPIIKGAKYVVHQNMKQGNDTWKQWEESIPFWRPVKLNAKGV